MIRTRIWVISGAVLLIFLAAASFIYQGRIRAWRYRNYCEIRIVRGSNWFDYRVGAPNARGYYRAQKFGGARHHLGEDWNGVGGGNSDYCDPTQFIDRHRKR